MTKTYCRLRRFFIVCDRVTSSNFQHSRKCSTRPWNFEVKADSVFDCDSYSLAARLSTTCENFRPEVSSLVEMTHFQQPTPCGYHELHLLQYNPARRLVYAWVCGLWWCNTVARIIQKSICSSRSGCTGPATSVSRFAETSTWQVNFSIGFCRALAHARFLPHPWCRYQRRM